MPKKPNRKELQNYIGAGNGDKSGEYTFDKGGGGSSVPKGTKPKEDDPIAKLNEDFELFDPSSIEEPEKEEKNPPIAIEEQENPQPIDSKDLADAVAQMSNFKPKEKEYIKSVITKGNADCNKLLKETIDSGEYKYNRLDKEFKEHLANKGYDPSKVNISCFIPKIQELALQPKDLKGDGVDVEGEVFYHESGHMVDNYNGQISVFYKDKNGNTLVDMLKKDYENIRQNNILDEISNITTDYVNKSIAEQREANKEIKEKQVAINNELKGLRAQYETKFYDRIQKEFEITQQSTEEQFDQSKEYREYAIRNNSLVREFNDLNKQKLKAEQTKAYREYVAKYSDVGDMIDGGMQFDNPTGFCHDYGYWNDTSRSKEFFAEYFSAKAINQQSSEMIAKYFPNAYKMMDEIIRSINNGRK